MISDETDLMTGLLEEFLEVDGYDAIILEYSGWVIVLALIIN